MSAIAPLQWNELKQRLEALFVPELDVRIRATPASVEEPNAPMIRYWITLKNEVIWDYPNDFPDVAESQTQVLVNSPQIAILLTEYLVVKVNDLLSKRFARDTFAGIGYRVFGNMPQQLDPIPLGLIELLLACDSRIDLTSLYHHPLVQRSGKAVKILEMRAELAVPVPDDEPEPPSTVALAPQQAEELSPQEETLPQEQPLSEQQETTSDDDSFGSELPPDEPEEKAPWELMPLPEPTADKNNPSESRGEFFPDF